MRTCGNWTDNTSCVLTQHTFNTSKTEESSTQHITAVSIRKISNSRSWPRRLRVSFASTLTYVWYMYPSFRDDVFRYRDVKICRRPLPRIRWTVFFFLFTILGHIANFEDTIKFNSPNEIVYSILAYVPTFSKRFLHRSKKYRYL